MNQLTKVFEKQDLTIIEVEGNFHFLLKDVCEILEIGQPAGVARRLEEDVLSKHPLQTAGGTQQATFVNEDGLYDVVLDSRKPEARRFRKWITSEVLPSIRKTGGYQVEQKQVPSLEIALQAALEHEREIKSIKTDVSYLKDNMRVDGVQQQEIQAAAKKTVVHALGGIDSNAYQELASKVFSAFWREFKNHFKVPRYGDIQKIKYDEAIRFIDLWRPSTSLQIDIDNINSQMNLIGSES